MSRAYRELVERYPEVYGLTGDDERDAQHMEQDRREWLEDEAAQQELLSWIQELYAHYRGRS